MAEEEEKALQTAFAYQDILVRATLPGAAGTWACRSKAQPQTAGVSGKTGIPYCH